VDSDLQPDIIEIDRSLIDVLAAHPNSASLLSGSVQGQHRSRPNAGRKGLAQSHRLN